MQVTIPITGLVVPTLTDNTNWFLNAAAWNAYWRNASFSITFNEADTNTYGLVKKAANTVYVPPDIADTKWYSIGIDINGDGNLIPCDFVVKSCFDNLKQRVDLIDQNYQALLIALKNAGVVENAI